MDVYDHRMTNLKALVAAYTAAGLAQRSEASAVYLSQILTGVKDRHGKPRRVGTDLARKLEVGAELEAGWMDNPQPGGVPVKESQPSSFSLGESKAKYGSKTPGWLMPLTKKQNEMRDAAILFAPLISDDQAAAITQILRGSVAVPIDLAESKMHFDVVPRADKAKGEK